MRLFNAPALIIRLAWLDLWHEWILTLCLILAIGGVIAPQMILMGLKHGVISTMRERLVQDPVYREIKPSFTVSLPDSWFEQMRQRNDVQFIIPTIMQSVSVVQVVTQAGEKDYFDMIATAEGDPLLMENGGIIPAKDEVVLSYRAAKELGVKSGDEIMVRVGRTYNGERQYEDVKMSVVRVLDPRADALPRLYLQSEFVDNVETYRRGLAVPQRNWSGDVKQAFFSYDGIWLFTQSRLDTSTIKELQDNTDFTDIEFPSQAIQNAFRQYFDRSPPSEFYIYRLKSTGMSIQPQEFKKVRYILRDTENILIPYVDTVPLKLENGKSMKIIGLSISVEEADLLGLPYPPWGEFKDGVAFTHQAQILLPDKAWQFEKVILESEALNNALKFSAKVRGQSPIQYAIVPLELMGSLKTAQYKHVVFDERVAQFVIEKTGHYGFRLYTHTIDDVPGLYQWFVEQGIHVETEVQQIQRVKMLDQSLTQIFKLIAAVGLLGAIAVLIVSLYAAVERKKREIGILRLMGLTRSQVFRFPIYQGAFIALSGTALAVGIYQVLSEIINVTFAQNLTAGQKICIVPEDYFVTAFSFTILLAVASSLIAAWKTTLIEPATAIREE